MRVKIYCLFNGQFCDGQWFNFLIFSQIKNSFQQTSADAKNVSSPQNFSRKLFIAAFSQKNGSQQVVAMNFKQKMGNSYSASFGKIATN